MHAAIMLLLHITRSQPLALTPVNCLFHQRPEPQMALVRSVELAELKRVLTTQMAKLPESRFDDSDAELMRFAIAAGILQVAPGTACVKI